MSAAVSVVVPLPADGAAREPTARDARVPPVSPPPGMAEVRPPPQRRRRVDDGGGAVVVDTPSTSSGSPEEVSASSSAPSPAAEVPPPLRRRLRFKQPGPAEVGLPVQEEVGVPQAAPEWWSQFPDIAQGADADINRQRYHFLRHRLRMWMEAERAGEDPLVARGAQWNVLPAKDTGELVQRFLRDTQAPPEPRAYAERVWPAGEAAQGNPRKGRGWLYQATIMLTYNGDWGVMPAALAEAGASWEVVVAALRVEPTATRLWEDYRKFVEVLCGRFPFAEWAASMELSVETWESQAVVRVHLHLFIGAEAGKLWAVSEKGFVFRGSVPQKGHGRNLVQRRKTKCNAGLYYLMPPKVGTVFTAGGKSLLPASQRTRTRSLHLSRRA